MISNELFNTLDSCFPNMSAQKLYDGKWSYDYAVVLLGVYRLYKKDPQDKYLTYIKNNISHFIKEDGSIVGYDSNTYNLDNLNNGKILIKLYEITGEKRYLLALEKLYEQISKQPRTDAGIFWHKKIYPYQVWLDGLYMGSPFYAEYSLKFGNPEKIEDVVHQYMGCHQYTKDDATGLMRHAWDESREQFWSNQETGQSAHAWGRAMGWYLLGLVDTIVILPTGIYKDQLISLFKKVISGVIAIQQNSGVWLQVLDREHKDGNYEESSCSCMFTAALARAINHGIVDNTYKKVVEKAWQGIMNVFVEKKENGLVYLHQTCQVAGLGGAENRSGTFDYYINETIVSNDLKAYGAFLQLAVEMEILENG